MRFLIRNIKGLVQLENSPHGFRKGEEMKILPVIENAFLLIEDGNIADFGEMRIWKDNRICDKEIDASGKFVLPCWCDSHTHIVYAGSRENEFIARNNGLSYEEIAKKGGGILNSAKKLQDTSEEELFDNAHERLKEIAKKGTGAVEIKSGYGLTLESELKMLSVINKLKSKSSLTIKATFLGAHAFPAEYKNNRKGYIDLIINEMIPRVQDEGLAEYIDVFCETNYFSTYETDQILKAGISAGLKPKVHVNQFTSIGGIEICVKNKALSVDHLEVMNENDIEVLKKSSVIPVLLPSCSFFLNIPYAPARKLIEANLPVTLASDFNPGSSPSGNMNFVISLACIKMKLSPEEAINASTINGAAAMGLEKELGSISVGKKANVFITKKIPTLHYLPYSFGDNLIETVILNGKIV